MASSPKTATRKGGKMKHEDIQSLGLTEEQEAEIFRIAEIELNAEKERADKAEKDRDDFHSQLDSATEQLKGFQGENDPQSLRDKIASMTTEMENVKNDYAAKIADRDFRGELNRVIRECGGRDEPAVSAFLDINALKESKNRAADMKSAIEAVKEKKAYLFTDGGGGEPIMNPVRKIGHTGNSSANEIEMARKVMGLKPKK